MHQNYWPKLSNSSYNVNTLAILMEIILLNIAYALPYTSAFLQCNPMEMGWRLGDCCGLGCVNVCVCVCVGDNKFNKSISRFEFQKTADTAVQWPMKVLYFEVEVYLGGYW